MRNTHAFENKKVLVIGLAKSGVSVAKLLHQLHADVTVNDRTPLEESVDAQGLVAEGIKVVSGGHPLELLDELLVSYLLLLPASANTVGDKDSTNANTKTNRKQIPIIFKIVFL